MSQKERYLEIDLARTIAIVGMVLYHLLYDLVTFRGLQIDLFTGPWLIFQRTIACLFLVLVGISFAISWSRSPSWKKYLRRGLWILSAGFVISLVTAVFDPDTYIRFGVLHLIGISLMLLPLFVSFKESNAFLGLGLIILGQWLPSFVNGSTLGIPFGFPPQNFLSVDYVPLLPWFGVILIGYAVGYVLYVQGVLRWHLRETSAFKKITTPGRWSLWIYLLHQPVLMSVILLTR